VNAVEALAIFIGLPILVGIVVAALVYSKSWTRDGRAGADYDSNPLLFASVPARPDPSADCRPTSGGAGRTEVGVSARW